MEDVGLMRDNTPIAVVDLVSTSGGNLNCYTFVEFILKVLASKLKENTTRSVL